MPIAAPGRNDPCPCGSERKFKHCCLPARTAEDTARLRLRAAEGRVVPELLRFTAETWGEPLMMHAWEEFWNYEDVPEDVPKAARTAPGRERLEALLAEFDREAADGPSSVTVHLAAIRDVLALTKPLVSGQKTR